MNGQEDARLAMVHSIQQTANNSAINSQHIQHLENMSKLIANEVSKNRVGLSVSFILINIGRMVILPLPVLIFALLLLLLALLLGYLHS